MHQAQREVWGHRGQRGAPALAGSLIPPLAGSLSGPCRLAVPPLAGSLSGPCRLAIPSDTGGGPSKHTMSAVGGATPRQRISNCLKEGIMEVFPEAMVGFIVTTGTLRSP